MTITSEERVELERLEVEFDGRGVDNADRIDFLRAKASFPTITDLIAYLQTMTDKDETFVFASADDVEYPCQFISLEAFIEDFNADPEG